MNLYFLIYIYESIIFKIEIMREITLRILKKRLIMFSNYNKNLYLIVSIMKN